MFDNCKNCLFYDKEDDDMRRSWQDRIIENDTNPDKHFCDEWSKQGYVIPRDIWEGKKKCPYFFKDTLKT